MMKYRNIFISCFLCALMIWAGVAIGQSHDLVPQLPGERGAKFIPPPQSIPLQSDLGTQREAKACSEDISLLCAAHTATRRDTPDCLVDNYDKVSLACKSYIHKEKTKN